MSGLSRRTFIAAGVAGASLLGALAALAQSANDFTQTADGLTAYIGIMPAEIVKDPTMHGGVPAGHSDHHIVLAIFDKASSARISDAMVSAKVSGLNVSGQPEKTMEPMVMDDMITYGNFFRLPAAGIYNIRVTIRRPGFPQPVVMNFKYDHFDP